MYDIEVIKKHLFALLSDLKNLEKHKNISENDFKNNLDLLWILERGIYLSLQNIFDIFAHIISADLNKKWESYADIGVVLFKEGIIDETKRDLLLNMSGFRNRLSHDYLGLDTHIIIDIVTNRLDDLYDFAELIANHVGIKIEK
jgi:uncharacterized protein YutE (UPF0331/DUF86 family)